MDDQSKAGGGTYRLQGEGGRTFDPAKTALLVIDPVNDFLAEEGGMTANLCVESTGRHAAERGYDVTFVRDAIGAENLPAYEASIRINFPLIGNAVLDTEDLLTAIGPDRLPNEGDDAYASDQLKLGSIAEVVGDEADRPGYILVKKGVFNRNTYIPLDAVVKVSEGKAFVNVPKLVVGKMPWDEPPTVESRRAKIGPAPPARCRSSTGRWRRRADVRSR